MSKQNESDPGELTRRALRAAADSAEPEISGILARVPAIMAEARERRDRATSLDPISALGALAGRAIPGMAAVAAALVLVALFVGPGETAGPQETADGLENLLLTGQVGDDVTDVLLEAMTERGSDHG